MRLKSILNRTFTGLLVFALFGCGSSAPAPEPVPVQPVSEAAPSGPAEGMDLDAAIREAARRMEARLPAGTEVALVSVGSPSAAFSENVINRLEAAIVDSGKLVVVDRAHLDQIRSEQGFQLSGEVDDNSAKEIGRLLGAGAIVTGSLADLGDVYSLTLKAINIQTATVAVSYLADLAKTTRIETLLAARNAAGSGRTAPTQTAPAAPPAQVTAQTVQAQVPAEPPAAPAAVEYAIEYKVGERGPAGGWVFYDKGRVTNGWRYLEAAPSETEFTAAWGRRGETVGTTSTGIGAGRRNGETLVNYLNEQGEIGGLAQVCSDLFIGGFDGWFLPSKDELDLMYKNLKAKRIGGFGDGWYWSSSEVDQYGAWTQRFSDGAQQGIWHSGAAKDIAYSVRAIRQF